MVAFGAPKFFFGTGVLMFALFFMVSASECEIYLVRKNFRALCGIFFDL